MRSIEARFNHFKDESISSYVAFTRAVRDQNFSKDSIARSFIKLVDKSDYEKDEKNQIINYLAELSNPLRTTK